MRTGDDTTATPSCPDGYEYAIKVKWDGLKEGCNCAYQTVNYYDSIRVGECSSNETYVGCYTVKEYEAQSLYVVHDAVVCAKRDNSTDFYSIHRPEKTYDKLNDKY